MNNQSLPCGAVDSVLADSIEDMKLHLPETVGSGLIKRQLQIAMRRFCQTTLIWRFVFEDLPIVAGQREYRLPNLDDTDVVRVIDVYGITGDREYLLTRREAIQAGSYDGFYEPEAGLIVFNQLPKETQHLRCSVALMPARKTERIPEAIYEEWKEGIEARAFQRIYMMPDKPWTHYELASHYNQVYQQWRDQARWKHQNDMQAGRPAYHNHRSIHLR